MLRSDWLLRILSLGRLRPWFLQAAVRAAAPRESPPLDMKPASRSMSSALLSRTVQSSNRTRNSDAAGPFSGRSRIAKISLAPFKNTEFEDTTKCGVCSGAQGLLVPRGISGPQKCIGTRQRGFGFTGYLLRLAVLKFPFFNYYLFIPRGAK